MKSTAAKTSVVLATVSKGKIAVKPTSRRTNEADLDADALAAGAALEVGDATAGTTRVMYPRLIKYSSWSICERIHSFASASSTND